MRVLLWAVLLVFFIPLKGTAQETTVSTTSGQEISEQSVLYIAQNAREEEKKPDEKEAATGEKLPPPPPKTFIATEKPIKGTLRGIVGEKKSTVKATGQPGATPVPEADRSKQQEAAKGEPSPEPSRRISGARKQKSNLVREELSLFNVSNANLRTIKTVIDDDFNLRSIVYGEELGFIRVCEADDDGNFKEVWKSPPLNAPVRGLFVDDIDRDGETEIVAYTSKGNIFIYGYQTHDLEYRTPENTYPGISCMVVANLDDDPQLELFYQASQPGMPGRLIQFDPKTQFEEWTSSREFGATDMIVGNVDADPDMEIILNSGEILSSKFKNIKWESNIKFGDRLYLIDIDSDGILELVTEYDQSYVRIIEINERREKW